MAYTVDFKTVSTTGLESSPVAQSLAGLRANEARYIWNKFKVPYVTYPIAARPDSLAWLQTILAERALTFAAKPLEICDLALPDMRWVEAYYQDGLVVNVMYSLTDPKKRAVGFKLSEGMAVPDELAGKFKFARQKSKLAGTIRGSFFVIKGSY
ncbi:MULTISPECIES: phage tail protein [Lacticaseibacillus]|jgi:hypothetical protein|uniref:Phage tail protein n=3 Tax=Lacticaseibacillus TaxID=2759736 RepID=A0AAN1EZF6_LACCA|nr:MULTISPECIES: phage tail protein [Lacticaseibacillus]ARY91947.1 phage tail protein [Lacticaseibacillus casei]KAB1970993.1 phage tail protein [Lacticaseibacillus casei]MDG3060829.1 phage tail protein [Lacticaseibacillus sp. BCRC 81376]WFB39375.1 phage tail protein [Lacticaseibacillus huelsenbergensis]WLV79849.1 phage tail protein [Lacticaseibacillus sp. NCIMB 15473]